MLNLRAILKRKKQNPVGNGNKNLHGLLPLNSAIVGRSFSLYHFAILSVLYTKSNVSDKRGEI